MTIHRNSYSTTSSAADLEDSVQYPSTSYAARAGDGVEQLTKAEQAVWSDPELLGRIEALLDDPSLAVPLDELD